MAGKKNKNFTIEILKSQYPDIHNQVFDAGRAEGKNTERSYFESLAGVLDGDNDLLVECYRTGQTEIEAVKMANEKLKKANAELAEGIAKQQVDLPEKKAVDPARLEFTEQQKEREITDSDEVKKVDEQLTEEPKK